MAKEDKMAKKIDEDQLDNVAGGVVMDTQDIPFPPKFPLDDSHDSLGNWIDINKDYPAEDTSKIVEKIQKNIAKNEQ